MIVVDTSALRAILEEAQDGAVYAKAIAVFRERFSGIGNPVKRRASL